MNAPNRVHAPQRIALYGAAFSLRSLGRQADAIARIQGTAELALGSFASEDEELADSLTGVAKIHLGTGQAASSLAAARDG